MENNRSKALKNYAFPTLLLFSILSGGLCGYFLGKDALLLKPLGDLFLNLIFTAIIPLIFFSLSSAIAANGSMKKLGKILFYMLLVFLLTGILAALYALFIVKWFPLSKDLFVNMPKSAIPASLDFFSQLVTVFSVPDFAALLSQKNILALVLFSILVGLATARSQDEGKLFANFLQAGSLVFIKLFSLIMLLAPIGFFAYFAVLVSELGPKIMGNYVRIASIYYASATLYFLLAYSIFAYLAGRKTGLKLFWANIFLPAATAVATCSSAASIPANLQACKAMGISAEIYETTVPLGSFIHKDGSVIGGIFKIAFLFGVFQMDFSSPSALLTALGVSLLVGTVMGAIPSGGMLGELLILSLYGFPAYALILVAAISLIIDPIATMLNVSGNTVGSMLIARFVDGRQWHGRSAKNLSA